MAKQNWKPTHNQTEVGFTVLAIKEATNKPGYVVVEVKYPTSDKVYTYCRKYTTAKAHIDGTYATVVDGCQIAFNGHTHELVAATRLYDTKGLKKEHNPGGANKAKATSSNIKAEMALKAIPTPTVPVTTTNDAVRHHQYNTIRTCLMANIPIYLAGPAGSGKNYTVEQIAKELGWNFYFSNSVQQEYKLTGFIDAGGNFHDTEFYKACTDGNDCIFFLDEMDASIPEVLVLLNAAIANGYFEFPSGKVNFDKVHFVAAGNTVGSGADANYTGRMVLDQATLDRFVIIDFGYDRNIELHLAKGNAQLVDFVHCLRDAAEQCGIRATFSYRCITQVTKLEAAGMDTMVCLKIAVFKGMDQDTLNTLKGCCTSNVSQYGTALRQLVA